MNTTDSRRRVLVKVLAVSGFYGLILINWIDLFAHRTPSYTLWLVLMEAAPAAVLLIFEDWEYWPLAVMFGLLVSLFNDLGYFFVGKLLFGVPHYDMLGLWTWFVDQLGFGFGKDVTTVKLLWWIVHVPSWMMGLSIYVRFLALAAVIRYWWHHPTQVARPSRTPTI